MLNKNVIKIAGLCVGGYVGGKLVYKATKEITKFVKTKKTERDLNKGRIVTIDGVYCKAEWVK